MALVTWKSLVRKPTIGRYYRDRSNSNRGLLCFILGKLTGQEGHNIVGCFIVSFKIINLNNNCIVRSHFILFLDKYTLTLGSKFLG